MVSAPTGGWASLDRRLRAVLVLLGATSFFEGYDRGLIAIALPQIRHTFGLTPSEASLWLAFLYIGALPALVLARRADRYGRRRLLLVSVAAYTVATAATAASPSIGVFVACQFAARLFLNAEAAIVWTIAAEELPAAARGFGFGFLAMNTALGVGAGAILFGGVLDPLGVSWRALYVAALPPLVVVGLLRRRITDTRRFTDAQAHGELADRWQAILAPALRRSLALVLGTALLLELTTQAQLFAIDFLETVRHLTPSAASLLLVAAGAPGIPVMIAAGNLSDRYGRRLVGCAFAALSVVGGIGFFWLPGGVPVLVVTLALVLIGTLGSWPVLGGYATELFPTAVRGQATAWAGVARVTGDAISLAAAGLLIRRTGSFSVTATVLCAGPLAAIAIVALKFPDTHGVDLELIAPGPRADRRLPVCGASTT